MAAPSELPELLIMVKDLPNDHPGTPHLMLLNSDRERLPSYSSPFFEVPATARRGRGSAVPLHYAMVNVPGDGAPAILVWPLTKHGRVVEVWGAGEGLSFRHQNQASECQTTMDLDNDVVSDGESDSDKPRNSRDNSNSEPPQKDLDALPDELPVELQYPRSPVRREEAASHNTTCRGSSENLQDSATKLPPMSLEEELRLREVAFHASFNFDTQRCTSYARCRSCLAFCQARLPEGRSPGSQLPEEECPPVLKNVENDEARQAQKKTTYGPKSRSSEYRGVTFYKRTGRWEAHIWHMGAQTYLGASATKEEAARTYDKAALLLLGPEVDTNFPPESYKIEIAYLYKLSKEQLGMYLRRDSRGFGAQVSYPGIRRLKNYYQAMYGSKILGTFAIEEDAARACNNFIVSMLVMDHNRAVYQEAARNPFHAILRMILDTHHVRSMPSYAAQRFAALYPDAVEGTQLRVQLISSASKRPSLQQSRSSPPRKKRSARRERKSNQGSTSPPAVAQAIAAPPLSGAAPAARPASSWSSCQAPRVPSVGGSIGEASSSGFFKFRLFNVEIRVEEPVDVHVHGK